MRALATVLFYSTVAIAATACGDDGPSAEPDASAPHDAPMLDAPVDGSPDDAAIDGGTVDASPDGAPDGAAVAACHELAEPAAILSTYPAAYSGTVNGAGADLTASAGVCAIDHWYSDTVGEDVVIRLTGLTVGKSYRVEVDDSADLAFYVITDCSDELAGPPPEACAILEDNALHDDHGDFRAIATEAYLVVDTYLTEELDGAFTVEVSELECVSDGDCGGDTPACYHESCVACNVDADCDGATPACNYYHECVGCIDSFDCTDPASPACVDSTCVAPPDACIDDDAGEPDDGVLLARPLAVGQVIHGRICNEPSDEADHFLVTTGNELELAVLTDDDPDNTRLIEITVFDLEGEYVSGGGGINPATAILPANGSYQVIVNLPTWASDPSASTTPYHIERRPLECYVDLDCTAEEPLCLFNLCDPGPTACTGDDEHEPDDGPLAATPIAGAFPVTVAGAICGYPIFEADWYRIELPASTDLVLDLAWTGGDHPMDVALVDHDTGEEITWSNSSWGDESTSASAAGLSGAYDIRVSASGGETAASPYQLTLHAP
jgi:hypothetical protein